MRLEKLTLGLVAGLSLATATAVFAEPAVQAGETIESLSKAQISTTVNGQAGSIQDLVSSGQVQIVSGADQAAPTQPAGQNAVAPQDQPAQAAPGADVATPATDVNAQPEAPVEQPSAN